MSDGGTPSANVFAPRKALRRTPIRQASRGPTPVRSQPGTPTIAAAAAATAAAAAAVTPVAITPAAMTPVPAERATATSAVAISPVTVTPAAATPVAAALTITPTVQTPHSDPREPSEEPALRAMTSPIRDIDDLVQVPASSNSIPATQTPRASTAEPTTPSLRRPPSSSIKASGRRQGTTPHTKRAYANRPTPHKNQHKRRNSRFMDEEDDMFMALKQLSRLEASKTQPWKDTPKAITPKAASSRRRTLDGIRLGRDPDAVSDEEDDRLDPRPRLSNVSLKLIGNDTGNDDEDDTLMTPPRLSSPLRDQEGNETLTGTPGEVARRAVADNDRRASFAPDPFDRFRIFDNVNMGDDSMVQGLEAAFPQDDEAFEAAGDGISALSFADFTNDLPPDDEVSNLFNAQGIADEMTDFRLEHEEPPELVNDVSSPPSMGDMGMGAELGAEFVDSGSESEGPIEFDQGLRMADGSRITKTNFDDSGRPAKRQRTKKELPMSAYGIPYPSMPPRVIKSIIGRSTKAKLSKETLNSIIAASEIYLENLGEDLGSFARHAKRKTVEEGDVMQVLRRHRLLNDKTTVFSLANQYLPRELLQDIKIQVPRKNLPKPKRRRQVDEDEAEDGDVTID